MQNFQPSFKTVWQLRIFVQAVLLFFNFFCLRLIYRISMQQIKRDYICLNDAKISALVQNGLPTLDFNVSGVALCQFLLSFRFSIKQIKWNTFS
jgi:hypothetical protein